MKPPKILIWDLETGVNVARIFSLFPKYIPHTALQSERYIICGAFKELGGDETSCISLIDDIERFIKDPTDDYYVVAMLHGELSKADALIAHYGDKFDVKYFNTRCVYHGFNPLPNIIQIDTYKIAKSKFLFNSNKLDYLGQFLGLGNKIKTTEQLWTDCLAGKVSAVQEMVEYNIEDVDLLERVYNKLAPFVPARMNHNLFTDNQNCPLCGSFQIIKKGFVYTRVNKYQGYLCKSCGHRFRGGAAEKKEQKGAVMR